MATPSFDPGFSAMQVAGTQANMDAVNSVASGAASQGATEMTFDGTIGDFQRKYPGEFQKNVLMPMALLIAQKCRHDNERLLQKMKETRGRSV